MTDKNTAQTTLDDDEMNRPRSGSKSDEKEKTFQRALAAANDGTLLTRNKSGEFYITFIAPGGLETYPLNSSTAANKIKRKVREEVNIRPSRALVEELIEELREEADSGTIECMEVHHRVAPGENGEIFIDLCNEKKEVLVVDAHGCQLVEPDTGGPLFLHKPGMTALPNPIGVVGNLELLRSFLNLASDAAWRLLVVFLLFSLRPFGPYVILIIIGVAGSSKSKFSRVLRSLTDPSSVPLQALPRSTVDLMITASNSHFLAFDNVRELSHEMSDAFCRLATGGGSRTRALYSNDEEVLFNVVKPCLLNGIDGVASQPDLLSRCIHLELPAIKIRRTEEEFDRSFEQARGPIFAGMMDALSKTLAALPDISEVPDTRMADFSRFGMAVERALGWPQDSFRQAYAQNQADQMWNALGDDPLALAVKTLVLEDIAEDVGYIKTPASMLKALDGVASQAQRAAKDWPQSPHSLSKRLKKIEPALRACGIGVEFRHSGNRSIIVTRLPGFKK